MLKDGDVENAAALRAKFANIPISMYSERYSNSNWREQIFETMFFEAWRLRKRLQMIVFIAAIVSDKFSSKSELSSRFFGHLKFFALFEYLSLHN